MTRPSRLRSLLLACAALALAACPQDLRGPPGADGGAVAPACENGPQVTCTAKFADSEVALVKDLREFQCQLPGPREDGAQPLLDRSIASDQPAVVLGASVDSSTGKVILQPNSITDRGFSGGRVTAYLVAYWEGERDACTTVELSFELAGNLWAADEANGQVLALDSAGSPVGDPLTLEGLDAPRLVSAPEVGQVLVGGRTGGRTVLAFYDTAGNRLRTLGESLSIANPLRAAASLGQVLFVSGGTLATGGELYVSEGGASPVWKDTDAGGLAATSSAVLIGLTGSRQYKVASSASVPGSTNDLQYVDSAGHACDVSATTALVHLSAGGFVFAVRHGPGTLGHLAWLDEGRRFKAVLSHDDTALPGALASDGPYDWLEELKPGVVLGTRDGKPGVERIELSKIASDDEPVTSWASGLQARYLKGLARLR